MIIFRTLGLLLTAFFVVGCGKTEPATAPVAQGPAEFVGSTACTGCHDGEYRDWIGSHHQLAMQEATAETVLGDFDDAVFDYFGATTTFFTREDGYYVRTADGDGQERDFRIAYTFGVEPLQQYLIEFPGGRLQSLAFSWDARPEQAGGQRWFHVYPDENVAPGDELHWTGQQQNWNYMCAECHSTNVKMGFDPDSNSFATTYSEISVGCEGCHGPGSTHVQRAEAGNSGGFDVNLDDRGNTTWVMNSETGIAERSEARMQAQQQPEACGRCHSRRGVITSDYDYGEPLLHTHLPSLLEEPLYFADGQIQDEVFVYGSFLQSRMYQAGVTCTDCHDPHTTKLITGSNPNDVCGQCHLPTKFALADHAGHLPEQAGCVDCHMADRTYMVVDDRRDHSFRIPRPNEAGNIGAPDACADCHSDGDADWASSAISAWRGDAALPRPHFGTALHAGRSGFANAALVEVANDNAYPGIVRATAVSLIAQPMGRGDVGVIANALGDADALVRMSALRQLRLLPAEARLQLPGAALLEDRVRGVRIEAVVTYAGMQDLLPIEGVRAYARAEREFRDAYESIANRPEALARLASFELAEGDPASAISRYEVALEIDPQAVPVRANLADTLSGLGEEARAESVLRQGIALDPSNADLRHALGLSMVRSQRPDDALAELRRAAELAPDSARYVYVLGIALNSMGQQSAALELLLDAHERFETDFNISMALATMLRDSGDQDAALQIAYTLARRHPEESGVIGLLRSLGAIP
jgi:predicted CXXCH cytochrome family protein